MQYLLQILHLSCQVQRLPGYQARWSVLLRSKMAERFASVSEYEFMWNMYNKTIIEFGFRTISWIYQNLVSVLSAEAEGWGR